jgi:hypothetical protein
MASEPGPVPAPTWTFHWVTSARLILDARAVLGNPRLDMAQFAVVLALVIAGMAGAVAGYVIGSFVAIFGVLFLVYSYVEPILIWRIKRRRGSLLGQPLTVVVDGSGLRSTSEFCSGQILWTAVTSVRSTDRIVLFMRGPATLAYIPAAAFASATERAEVVAFARSRLGT